ncbi:hypothetical protein NFI96_013130 [Prochilodus magdalenae]|nr:hypothetical protein NFI96_013130 [Prochilodus magdalenae]
MSCSEAYTLEYCIMLQSLSRWRSSFRMAGRVKLYLKLKGVESSGDVFSEVTNHDSPSGNLMDKSGFGGCQENGTCLTALCRVILVWGCRSGVGLGPLVPVRGTLNASADQEIPDNFMLPTLWEQFGNGHFLFQQDCKARNIKTWMRVFGVEDLDWPAQSPDLNPIEHLWDELEQRLRARSYRPTSLCKLTNSVLEEWSKSPINTFLNLVQTNDLSFSS